MSMPRPTPSTHTRRSAQLPLRVVLTGSESVGKTTLAAELGAHYRAPVVPEFVRGYAQRIARPITYDDLLIIATEQAALEDEHLA
ncbi:MAG: ATP-binding protein, partial [Gemmatimonadaceae bacterium]|nr:ATP-binding protein [Gemmatimonadaceae bacterium]